MLVISSVCYGAIAITSLIFGLIYLTRSQFMPYHSLALAKSGSEVEVKTQILILALMRVAGGGFISTGIAILYLLCIPFQAEATWAKYSIFLVCLGTSTGSCYATLLVKLKTPGNPPAWLSVATILLSIVGLICSLLG